MLIYKYIHRTTALHWFDTHLFVLQDDSWRIPSYLTLYLFLPQYRNFTGICGYFWVCFCLGVPQFVHANLISRFCCLLCCLNALIPYSSAIFKLHNVVQNQLFIQDRRNTLAGWSQISVPNKVFFKKVASNFELTRLKQAAGMPLTSLFEQIQRQARLATTVVISNCMLWTFALCTKSV